MKKLFIAILAIMSILGFGYVAFGEVFQGYYQNVIIGVDVNEKNNTTSTNVTAVNTSSTNIFFQTATGTTICLSSDCKTTWPSGTVSFPIPYASTTGIQATLSFPLVAASTTDNTAFPIGLASTTGLQATLSFPLGLASTTGIQGTLSFPLAYASTSHLTATTPLTITSGILSMPTSTASQDGFLKAADWLIFSSKITTTSLSETITGIDYNNGTGVFSTTAGYVGLVSSASSTDWTNKLSAETDPLWIASSSQYLPYTGGTGVLDVVNLSGINIGNVVINLTGGGFFTSGTGDRVEIGSPSSSAAFAIYGNDGAQYAVFDISPLSAQRVFTFPNSAGTIALTSNLSSYQPLLTFPLAIASTSPSLASSSISINIFDATTTLPYTFAKWRSPVNLIITEVSCDEYASATSTINLFRVNTLGSYAKSSDIVGSISCGNVGATTTSFTTSTVGIGQFIVASTTAITGTPTLTVINIKYYKQ